MSDEIWNGNDLVVPMWDFAQMFKLTEKEVRREGISGRFSAIGRQNRDGTWSIEGISESEIRRWLHSNLPPRVARKVAKAGSRDRLQAWRVDYWSKIQFDVENNSLILPDGQRIADLRFGEDTRRIWQAALEAGELNAPREP